MMHASAFSGSGWSRSKNHARQPQSSGQDCRQGLNEGDLDGFRNTGTLLYRTLVSSEIPQKMNRRADSSKNTTGALFDVFGAPF